jgi:hypothetical protein
LCVYLDNTTNACITPGSQPIRVRIRLIQNFLDKPYCIATPNGGRNIARIIDKIDIVIKFKK